MICSERRYCKFYEQDSIRCSFAYHFYCRFEKEAKLEHELSVENLRIQRKVNIPELKGKLNPNGSPMSNSEAFELSRREKGLDSFADTPEREWVGI